MSGNNVQKEPNVNMKPCKACGQEISKSTKQCPHCGHDQRSWFMRHKFLSFIGIIVILGILGNALGEDDATSDTASKTNKEAETKEEVIYQLNEEVPLKKTTFTLTKVDEMKTIGDPSFLGKEAADGAILVGVQYTVKNATNEPISGSTPTLKLLDENGVTYKKDFDTTTKYATEVGRDTKVVSELSPGVTVKGVAGFEIGEENFDQGSWFVEVEGKKIQIK